MRNVWIYSLCLLVLSGIICPFIHVPASASPVLSENMSQVVIPTKYRLLLTEIIDPVTISNETILVTAVRPDHLAVKMEEIASVQPSSHPVSPDPSYESLASAVHPASFSGMGKGMVSTNFAESVQEQGTNVDNREKYSFSGLFDVHVSHSFGK